MIDLCVLVAIALVGCNRGDEVRTEARALVERLNKLTPNGSLTERKQALDALEQLQVREPEHVRARDTCRNAYLQLLQAEAAQVSARKALDDATRARATGGAPISSERAKAIADELQQSSDALAAAQREFPKCRKATDALMHEAR